MSNPTKNSQVVVERLPGIFGASNQRLNIVLNAGKTAFSLYLEDRDNSDFQSNADSITTTGLPLAASASGSVTGSGTTNQVPKWTDGPNSVLGDSSIADTGAVVTITIPSLVLVGTTITFPDNIRQVFNPGANAAGLNVGAVAADPTVPVNGDLWYDSALNLLRARINGVSVSIGPALAIGDTVTGGTVGSVLFVGAASALAQDNANLFWDDTNNRLGIGNAAPTVPLDVTGNALISGIINTQTSAANVSIGKTSLGSKFEVYNNVGQAAAFSFRSNDFVLVTSGTSLDMAFGATSGNTYAALQVYNTGAAGAGNLVINAGGGAVLVGTTNILAGRTMVIGGNLVIGTGDGTAGPTATGIIGATGTGTNIAGAALVLAGGQSSGSGLGGEVRVQVANKQGTGTTQNNLATVFTIAPPNTGTTAPVNGATLTGAIAGSSPSLAATGSDTDINLNLAAKGAGVINLNGVAVAAAATATPANGSTAARLLFGTTAGFGIYYGSGAPNVVAAKGSLYLRSDGSGVADRAYINTDGATAWTAIATAG